MADVEQLPSYGQQHRSKTGQREVTGERSKEQKGE